MLVRAVEAASHPARVNRLGRAPAALGPMTTELTADHDRPTVSEATFVRAETDRMFSAFVETAGGVNRWHHARLPTPLDEQTVIRMNQDTLYSMAVVDVSEGASVTLPDGAGRYVSVMVVDRDHHVVSVLHDPGTTQLDPGGPGQDYVVLAARVLVDPADPADVAVVHALQDGLAVDARAARPFDPPAWDRASLDATRDTLLERARASTTYDRAFGRPGEVDPEQHLLGTAAGWGGLPTSEAVYVPLLPPGDGQDGQDGQGWLLDMPADVPVDGFWSVSLYGRDGYFPDVGEPVSLNSVTAQRDPAGGVAVRVGGPPGQPNRLPTVEGWNLLVRLYRPRPEVRDGRWTVPSLRPA